MSQLSTLSSDADVERAIEDLLATKPLWHNMRWELEVQRRRLVVLEAEMKEAKAAYDSLNKTMVLHIKEEAWKPRLGLADAHTKAFNEAQSKYSLARNCWISHVAHAEEMLRSAKLFDEIALIRSKDADTDVDDYEDMQSFRFLSEAAEGTPEAKRNAALQEAERLYREDCEEVRYECVSFYRSSFANGRSSAIRTGIARARRDYAKAIAAIEEEYYEAC